MKEVFRISIVYYKIIVKILRIPQSYRGTKRSFSISVVRSSHVCGINTMTTLASFMLAAHDFVFLLQKLNCTMDKQMVRAELNKSVKHSSVTIRANLQY